MKFSVVLVGLGLAVMVVMIFQAVRQEIHLRSLKTGITEKSTEVKRKEQSIIDLRVKLQEMKATMVSVKSMTEKLKISKTAIDISAQEHTTTLQTCIKKKADVQKRKANEGETILKLTTEHTSFKENAEGDIQNLKKQILERDQAICVFVDTTKEEARKLCGIQEAPK
ncbi:uncharacterized protein si:dkey-87o1.2 [Anoplopoma fimbria]|uniref:uncharacterized protein si:dkey-87o1.2 n=1 Tax=Anoplopoma fimbria TaxID=229290 RepID=UPI0023EBBE1B|nr:uncharacterized protein si:dkey-87o1.2 [Anoplopoma fimbria]